MHAIIVVHAPTPWQETVDMPTMALNVMAARVVKAQVRELHAARISTVMRRVVARHITVRNVLPTVAQGVLLITILAIRTVPLRPAIRAVAPITTTAAAVAILQLLRVAQHQVLQRAAVHTAEVPHVAEASAAVAAALAAVAAVVEASVAAVAVAQAAVAGDTFGITK